MNNPELEENHEHEHEHNHEHEHEHEHEECHHHHHHDDEDEDGECCHHHHHDDEDGHEECHHHDDEDEDEECCHHHHHHDDEDEDEECCHHHHHHDDDDEDDDGHHHHHHHGGDDDEEEHSLKKIILAAGLFVVALLIQKLPVFAKGGPIVNWNDSVALGVQIVYMALFFAAYMLTGYPVVKEAVHDLVRGHIFGEEFLMAVATVGAIVMGEYAEAVAVMILFQLGEYLEDLAVDRSKRSITKLMDVRPDVANVKRGTEAVQVLAKDVAIGDIIVVKPGERIALDGIIENGKSFVDTSALTGESVAREVVSGDSVLGGFVNKDGVLEIKVTKLFGESTVSRVLEMVENAQGKKAKTQKFITRFARYYTPVVCLIALAVALVPPLVMMAMGSPTDTMWKTWIYRALEILVVSCPCALVISVPLSFFAGIGLASKNGILVKGSNYIEQLARTGTAVFDKTGTLTLGVFEVTDVHPVDEKIMGREELIAIATHAEYYSTHPISKSLKKVHSCEKCNSLVLENTQEISGHGIKCQIEGKTVLAGNLKLMEKENVAGFKPCAQNDAGTVVHVALDGQYMGHIVISDVEKDDSARTISELKSLGVRQTVLLTGDRKEVADDMGRKLGMDKVYSELLPGDKVSRIEELLESQDKKEHLIFVGDGINDAPVLTRADVGIAMGAMGSDAAIEAADVVVMDDKPYKVAGAIKLSRKTMRTVWQNVFFALGIKLAIMVVCALGFGSMWMAVFGDVGVTLLSVLHSMGLLWSKKI
ncbi:MAG: cadmium-translocating P-type ATPase [Treponema sp.]|nr:cadmium-translocating P-type ATPase [Treponema sp.]